MRNLVVHSDLTPVSDSWVAAALRIAAEAEGEVAVIGVLPGSLIDKTAAPAEAGRRRRAEENRARSEIEAQLARLEPAVPCHGIAVFGDVAFDTLLLARNLGADAVVVPSTGADTAEFLRTSTVPVIAVPTDRPDQRL
jgi:nucleotide-binding universal stress UspA family protein